MIIKDTIECNRDGNVTLTNVQKDSASRTVFPTSHDWKGPVAALRQRLDATFERIGHVAELLSDFARYLCVLVKRFLEQSVVELVLEHVRRNSSPTVQNHIEARLRRQFANANSQRLIDLMSTFDPDWGVDLRNFLDDEYKDAVDSVGNQISHGVPVGVTMTGLKTIVPVKKVVDHIADIVNFRHCIDNA